MRVHSRFVISAADAKQFPASELPEVAFLGRSNVGKSSVLNSLVGEKIARTSGTPGRTRTINFFEIRRPGNPRSELMFAALARLDYRLVGWGWMLWDVDWVRPRTADRILRRHVCLRSDLLADKQPGLGASNALAPRCGPHHGGACRSRGIDRCVRR